MQIFNLTQYAGIKAEKYIQSNCGGRYTRKEAYGIGGIGVGKLRYRSGIGTIDNLDTQERFRANMETFRQGLGIYVRSLSYNYLLAIPTKEIIKLELIKDVDLLKETSFSWTRKLLDLGMPYHYARVMLLDQEISETHEPYLSIETLGGDLQFLIKRYDPQKILHYFQEGPFSSIFSSRIESFKYT